VLDDYKMPQTWLALYIMTLDDKGRLWVATITDNQEGAALVGAWHDLCFMEKVVLACDGKTFLFNYRWFFYTN
jgi:hypothetical protein